MITFDLDANYDLYLTPNGQLSLIDGISALALKVRQRLALFLGEWFLDTTRGVPYFQNILGYNKNTTIVTNIISTEIRKEPEVINLLNPSFTFEADIRKYSYSATIVSQYGQEKVSINGYY